MISFRIVSASLVTTCLLSSAAPAASVMNRDDKDHKVTVVEGDVEKDHILKPNAVISDICQAGCLIRLDDSDEDPYELEGPEVTSIEGGQLYDDELEVPAVAPTGDTGQPSPSGSQR